MNLRLNYPIATHNSWRIGGNVEVFSEPTSKDELVQAIQYTNKLPIIWLGLGSNVLFQDDTLPAMVIKTQKALCEVKVESDFLYAQAGVTCAKVSKVSTRSGLLDLAFLAGVPGTVGGALAMNAGAFGQEIWDYVQKVEWLWPNGKIEVFNVKEFEYGYRKVKFPDQGCFYGAWFLSQLGDPHRGKIKIKSLLQKRGATQPIGQFSCGSVFKNPPGIYAAECIQKAGLKGLKMGGAMISHVHANFIVNESKNATCKDVMDLVLLIQSKIHTLYGIHLEPEFHYFCEENL